MTRARRYGLRHAALATLLGTSLGLALACAEGSVERDPNACDGTREQLQRTLEALVADGSVPAGTLACGEPSLASGSAPFAPGVSEQTAAATRSYFANACTALTACE